MTSSLLTTKLHIPLPRADLVPRSRLINLLNTSLEYKLTLISAPAGFGKSTLLSSWVNQIGSEVGVSWLSLEDSENDLPLFLAYFVAALQKIDLHLGENAFAILKSTGGENVEAFFASLLNEISEISKEIIIILDDYQAIESQKVDQAINYLINHLPPNLHLIIASRIDPSLSLSRLRASRQLFELRADDLRFTIEEAKIFLNKLMGFDLTVKEVAALGNRTEGWIAGLQLAALSMQGQKGSRERNDFITSFTGSHRYIHDYLTDEVLKQQPEPIRNFLLKTSILKRLNAPLCDAVTMQNDSQAILHGLEIANLFIIPLDNERFWYRYHHLFMDLLLHRLRLLFPDLISELHQRASSWYLSENYIDAALHHAQAAGDNEQIVYILEHYWQEIIHRGELTKLKQLLDALGPETTRKSAPLSMAYCWFYNLTGETDPLPFHIQNIRKIWQEINPEANLHQPIHLAVIPSLVETMEAVVALNSQQSLKAKEHAKKAISLIPDDPNPATRGLLYGAAGFRLAQAQKELGEYDQACDVLLEILEILKFSQNYVGAANTIYQIVTIYRDSDKEQEAIKLCEENLDYIEEHQWNKFPPSGMVHLILAELQVDSGNIETARENLEIGQQISEPMKSPLIQHLADRIQEKLENTMPSSQPLVEPLSERELEVLKLVAQGLSNREISERLYLALDTVKGYNRRIFGKLGVRKRIEAVESARKFGLL
ncbi:MAG: hypothetical protein JEZ06_12095 [Anaerolineaceae bacterium]|nr:hypothetical protein [Anaerolineaceae bacterium]